MSDFMPDKIIARPMMGTLPQDKTHTSGPWSLDDPYKNGKLYISADLPPTRDQIMADPRVMALVEAVRNEREMPCQDISMLIEVSEAVDAALAALTDNEGETE